VFSLLSKIETCPSKFKFILDSGANEHMLNNMSLAANISSQHVHIKTAARGLDRTGSFGTLKQLSFPVSRRVLSTRKGNPTHNVHNVSYGNTYVCYTQHVYISLQTNI